ncbi:MAG: multicopper oxidase domain-containing protein [Streptosporangiales bacterium]|nr:multicopper oxidase domain-containing protein [Streptosporangiales bacterium]
MRRRRFLTATALTGFAAGLGTTLTGCDGGGFGGGNGNAGRLGFTNRLKIPPQLRPRRDGDGVRRFELGLRPGRREFRPGEVTETWGINAAFLGPTLRASRGDRVAMRVANRLPETSTLHWHGMRLPARMDGGPHQPIEPGTTWSPSWTIDQPAGTLWYHPHPHGETARHVYKGLAGMFILDDPESRGLALPDTYGVDDVPLIVADRLFGEGDGRGRDIAERAVAGSTFGLLGDDILVNGTYDPYFAVTTERVRLRVLNAANARMFHLGFSDDRTFQVIATDSGLLPEPVEADRVRLSPGERVEIVVGFAPGERVVLTSASGDEGIDEEDFDLIRFTAARTRWQRGRTRATPCRT